MSRIFAMVKVYYQYTSIFIFILLLLNVSFTLNNHNSNVFAQSSSQGSNGLPSQGVQPNLFFVNVHVDTNPLPNKPFQIYADIQDPNPSDLIAHIAVPQQMSVLSPIIPTPTFTISGGTMRVTWTVMASHPGSFPVTITAHSNFPFDTETLDLVVNVGSPNSLIVTGINIPGSIVANDNFTVGITLKNTSIVRDENILARISVPSGLQLLSSSSSNSISLDPNKETSIEWNIRAESSGSYPLIFNYSSINSGPGSITANVNIGAMPVATGALLSISAEPIVLVQNDITPVTFDIKNNDIHQIHHLQIVSASGGAYTSVNTPAWVGDLDTKAVKKITLNIYTSNGTLGLKVPVEVKYDSGGVSYSETYLAELPLENQPNFKISSVTVTPFLAFAGDRADKIDMQIFNLGQGINDVHTTLNLPGGLSPAWGNATSAYFGRIDTFQTVTASFFVDIDSNAIAGSYPLSLKINAGKEQTTLNVNFVVSKKAAFQVISVDSSHLYPGATNVPFQVTMRNVGTAAAQTITTKLLSGNAAPGVKSSTITIVGNVENIGTILANQVFTTTFIVNLDPTFVPGDQSTSIEVDWTQNGTNNIGANNFVQTVAVPYHVSSGPLYLLYYSGIPWSYVIITLFLVISLYIFIRQRRKRMKLIKLTPFEDIALSSDTLVLPKDEPIEDVSAEKRTESQKPDE